MTPPDPRSLPTGVPGLDAVLRGGLFADRLFLVAGQPGTGKTTVGLQFLREGVSRGEKCLHITLNENEASLSDVATSHGWDLEGIDVFATGASTIKFDKHDQYTLFHPSEIELGETLDAILNEIERRKPKRLVIDPISELSLLAKDPLRYRRTIMALTRYVHDQGCTALLLDTTIRDKENLDLHGLVHGVITLEQSAAEFGINRRHLRVTKLRGVAFQEGSHDFVIKRGGLEVFPRLVAAEHRTEFKKKLTLSGVRELDDLMVGGLPRGTSTLLLGAAGTGKSSIAMQYAIAALLRNERVANFSFDEGLETIFARTKGFGTDLTPFIESEKFYLRQIDPAEISPGEFASIIRTQVESRKARLVIIDSLNGYMNAMPDQRYLLLQLHEILAYLRQQGVVTILSLAQHGLVGETTAKVDLSYLADNVFLLRYFEYRGEVRKAISVMKKRTGGHEHTIRELSFSEKGVGVGQPIRQFEGVLAGSPRRISKARVIQANA